MMHSTGRTAFNVDHAAPGVTRPIALVINDYNTEQAGKRDRLHTLVADLLSRGIPVDIVGHQFHASLSTSVQSFDDALTAFEDLAVEQVVSELDVMTGTPVNDAKLIEQGYFYRGAFRIFRAHSASIFCHGSGCANSRSWGSDNAAALRRPTYRKPAYLEPSIRRSRACTAPVFQANVPPEPEPPPRSEWQKLRLIDVGDRSIPASVGRSPERLCGRAGCRPSQRCLPSGRRKYIHIQS
jgi:endo-1,4-beta-xylanase